MELKGEFEARSLRKQFCTDNRGPRCLNKALCNILSETRQWRGAPQDGAQGHSNTTSDESAMIHTSEVGAQVGDVTLDARRPPTNDILDGARIEDVTLHDSSSNDRGGHQIDRHHRVRPVMVGASAAAPHDSGQAAGVQEHRGKRKGHEDGSGVHRGKRDWTDKMKLGRVEKEDT
jgi:hypothetical protein